MFDAVRLSDMDLTKIDILQKMMACVRQSHAAYKRSLQLKKDKQAEEEKHAREDRKRKSMIASLQQRKKQDLQICAAEMAVRYAALSACRKVHVCHCNSLGGAT